MPGFAVFVLTQKTKSGTLKKDVLNSSHHASASNTGENERYKKCEGRHAYED